MNPYTSFIPVKSSSSSHSDPTQSHYQGDTDNIKKFLLEYYKDKDSDTMKNTNNSSINWDGMIQLCIQLDIDIKDIWGDEKSVEGVGGIVKRLELLKTLDGGNHHQPGCQLWTLLSKDKFVFWSHKDRHLDAKDEFSGQQIDSRVIESGSFGKIRVTTCCDGKHNIVDKQVFVSENSATKDTEEKNEQIALIHEMFVGAHLNNLISDGCSNFVWTHGLVGEEKSVVVDKEKSVVVDKETKSVVYPSELYIEYVEGKPLKDWYKSERTPAEVGSILIQIGSALLLAGDKWKFNHHDLHLGNIMIRIRELPNKKRRTYQFRSNRVSVMIHYEAVIIDYGRSVISVHETRFLPGTYLKEATEPHKYEFLIDYYRFLQELILQENKQKEDTKAVVRSAMNRLMGWQLTSEWQVAMMLSPEVVLDMGQSTKASKNLGEQLRVYGTPFVLEQRRQLDEANPNEERNVIDTALWLRLVKGVRRNLKYKWYLIKVT